MPSSCSDVKAGSNLDTQDCVEASQRLIPTLLAPQKRRFQEYSLLDLADDFSTGDQNCSSNKRALVDINQQTNNSPHCTTTPNKVTSHDLDLENRAPLKDKRSRSNSENSNFSGPCYTLQYHYDNDQDESEPPKNRKFATSLNRSTIENHSPSNLSAMGHASSKRSRQEPGHRVVQMSGSRSHKRYLDGYKESAGVRAPGKDIRRNDTEGDEDDHERSQWNQKKMSSKDIAPISRAFSSHQPRFLHASAIKLHKLQFGIDKRVTIVDEKSNAVLKYRTPHFRALATVEIPPLPAGVNIQVGWIQVCTDMQFINTYGNEGLTSWEFPEIVSGKYKMVSDADGKQYPWYGSKNEVAHLQGPTQTPTTATIHMNDNFFPQVTWYIPSIGYTRDPSLTFVYRKQRFYTFLALKDVNTDTYQIIRTLTWSMELAIDVNPKNPLGKRAKLLGPFEQESPKVVPEHLTPPLKSYALNPPNANSCQVLVWRPKYGDTELVVPPVQTTMDMSRYLISTRDATSKLLRITKSNFLLQQQQK